MMAVESNKGGNGTTAAGTPASGTGAIPGPAATLAGMPAVSANGKPKRKRPSSLMAQAAELPSVENSLDEFIARANETLVDPESFNNAKIARAAEDEQRKEADAFRWKAAESQMKESQVREQSLRRQLDGLQGQLAAAEARAAVAGTGASQDNMVVADLKGRLSSYDEKLREAEARSQQLARELEAAKQAQQAVKLAAASDSLSGAENEELEQRARIAEAKAAKALAAARAAAAGLTVSNADLAAIESGLVVAEQPKKGMSWGGVIAAFVVGGAIMFTVAFVLMKNNAKPSANTAPAANAQQAAQPQAAPTPAVAPTKAAAPTVTPIDDDKAKADDSAKAADTAKADDTAKAADTAAKTDDTAKDAAKTDDTAKADDAAAKKADDAAAKKAAAEDAAAAKKAAAEDAAPKKATPSAAQKAAAQQAAANRAAAAKAAANARAEKAAAAKAAAAKKQSSAGIADPFGDSTPAPKKTKKASGGGGIVDPF